MGGKLRHRIKKDITLTAEHMNWLNNYHRITDIPITKIIERFINEGITNIDKLNIESGNMKGTKRKCNEFLFEQWIWLEQYQSLTGINPSKVINAFIQYGINNIEGKGV